MPSSRRSFLAGCAVGIGALSGCLTVDQPTADGSWPRRTLDNQRTGHADTDGPTADLHTAWSVDRPDSGVVVTSPVVEDGTLYLAYSRERGRDDPGGAWVEAFDAATGESRWQTELFRTAESYYFYHSDSLVVDGDRLFVQTKPGLTMLSTDGEVRWRFDNLYAAQQRPDVVTPFVTDDVVVTGTYASGFEDDHVETAYGLDPATGEELWRTTFPERDGMLRLSGTDDVVVVPFANEGLVALDPATGEELWRWAGRVDGTATVAGPLLLVPGRDAQGEHWLSAVERGGSEVRWEVPLVARTPEAGVSVDGDGHCYLVNDLAVEARRLDDGSRVWRFGGERGESGDPDPDEPVVDYGATPVVSGGTVYALGWVQRDTAFGHLFTVDAATGAEADRVELGRNELAYGATPAVTSDLVFCCSNYGTLYAFGVCSVGVGGYCLVD